MLEINDEEKIFINSLLEDELGSIYLKRIKSNNIKLFDEVYSERIIFIKDLIKKTT